MQIGRHLLAIGFICLMLAVAGIVQQKFQGTFAIQQNTSLQALVSEFANVPLQLDPVVRTGNCQVMSPLPDHDCTPGAVFGSSTPEDICTPGYSKNVRNVSTTLKKKIYAAYGISYPQQTGTYELDHLIPLELGGSNDPANLFPESATPTPGFHEKDIVEDYLHLEMCAGHISLAAAQKQIALNWVAVYQTLSPSVISHLKQQFRSWAD